MKHVALIVAAIASAGFGVDVIHSYHSTVGLIVGAAFVLLTLLLAVPAQMHTALSECKDAWGAFKNPQAPAGK